MMNKKYVLNYGVEPTFFNYKDGNFISKKVTTDCTTYNVDIVYYYKVEGFCADSSDMCGVMVNIGNPLNHELYDFYATNRHPINVVEFIKDTISRYEKSYYKSKKSIIDWNGDMRLSK